MPEQVQCYQCVDCREIYPTNEEATACEGTHKDFENLKLLEVKFVFDQYVDNRGYPDRIRIEDSQSSGSMAEYSLVKASSVEDFEPFNTPIDGL